MLGAVSSLWRVSVVVRVERRCFFRRNSLAVVIVLDKEINKTADVTPYIQLSDVHLHSVVGLPVEEVAQRNAVSRGGYFTSVVWRKRCSNELI